MKYLFQVLLLFHISSAQTLTLPEAIELGLKNRSELKTQALQLQLDQQQDAKIKASWLPQVSASGDLRYNAILQKSVLPIGEFGLPGISPDATTTVAFGVPFNTSVGIDASQKIFDPNKNIDKKINANLVENQLTVLEKQRKDIRYAITEAYYNVLLQKEKVKLAEEAVSRAQVNLENGQTKLNAGTAQKTLAQAQHDLEESEKNIALARQVYATDLFRLEKGNIVLSDLKNSEFTLQTTENNYIVAVYYLLMAGLKLAQVLEE